VRRALIITALPVERVAVLEHLRDVAETRHPQGSVYRRGTFDDNSAPWDVLVAEIGPGNEGAAAEAERAIQFHEPTVAIFVGVAGALKDFKRGDVIASTKIYNYESGKDADAGFAPRPDTELPAYPLVERARYEAGERQWRQRIKGRVGPSPPEGQASAGDETTCAAPLRDEPAAAVGPIAAGPKVLASTRSAVADFIRHQYGDAVAVEMEGHGFLRGVRMNPPVQGIVVRGLSDSLEDKTADADRTWQPRAARHAAAFTFQILAKLDNVPILPTASSSSPVEPDRRQILERALRESKARSVERWQALGVTHAQALALADDEAIGAPAADLVPAANHPLRVIVGELGVGKSLSSERWYQENVRRALESSDAPAPIYIEVDTTVTDLIAELHRRTEGLPDWQVSGVALVLDRLERAGPAGAERLLQAARRLVVTYPGSLALLTSRHLSVDIQEAGTARELGEADALSLVSRFAGARIDSHTLERWPPSLRSAVRRPLFAILVGVDLLERPAHRSRSVGAVLARLVERALGDGAASDEPLLRKLAMKSIDIGYGTVRAGDVGGPQEVGRLIASNLVVRRHGTLAFALDVVADWFAAHALAESQVDLDELIDDPPRLERWRYPLAIAAGLFPHDVVSRILRPLASRCPAFASQVVDEAMSRYAYPDDPELPDAPPSRECGEKIREAMAAWSTGLGQLAQSVAPLEQDGSVLPIRVVSQGARLLAVWAPPASNMPHVTEISQPLTREERRASYGWSSARPAIVSAWAWSWTLDDLSRGLQSLVKRRKLPLIEGPLLDEEIWREAIFLDRRRSGVHPQRLSVSALLEWIQSYGTNILLSDTEGPFDLELLRARLHAHDAAQQHNLVSPWPGLDHPEIHGRLSWSGYSAEQFRERTKMILDGALHAYDQLVNEHLPSFKDQLPLATLLPVKFVARFPSLEGLAIADRLPTVEWYFEPLQTGEVTHAAVSVAPRTTDPEQLLYELSERVRTLRPNRAHGRSLGLHLGEIRIFDGRPATEIAYTWLQDDLKAVRWTG
jgi:nucleoside phosphorylase